MKRLLAGLDDDAGADRHRPGSGPATSTIRPFTPDDAPVDIDAVDVADLLRQRFHCENLKFWPLLDPRFNFVFTRIINHCVTVFGD